LPAIASVSPRWPGSASPRLADHPDADGEPVEPPGREREAARLLAGTAARVRAVANPRVRATGRPRGRCECHQHEEDRDEERGNRTQEVFQVWLSPAAELAKVRVLQDQPRRIGADIGARPTADEIQEKRKQKRGRSRGARRSCAGARPAERVSAPHDSERERGRQECPPRHDSSATPRPGSPRRHSPRQGRGQNAEKHEDDHVVCDRGDEHDPRSSESARPRSCSTRAVMRRSWRERRGEEGVRVGPASGRATPTRPRPGERGDDARSAARIGARRP